MKFKLLLCLAIFVFAAQIFPAQETQNSAREKYEAWKQEKIVAGGLSGQHFFYLVADARKIAPEIAVINFGIAGFKDKFEVTVTPIKTERDADGNLTKIKLPEAGKIRMDSGNTSASEAIFTDPTMKIAVDAQADALQIEFKFDDETAPKFATISLSETPSTGKFVRLESKKNF